LIALAAAIFLLSANLDAIPDCPELLNASSKASVSVQFAHLYILGSMPVVSTTGGVLVLNPAISTQYFPLEVVATSQPGRTLRLLHQAADSSPPDPFA
jgi:hypothetical protein